MLRSLCRCVLLAVVLCVVCAERASACIFPPPLEPVEAYSRSAAVLRGRVLQMVYAENDPQHRLGAVLDVAQVWKGSPSEQVYVRADWTPLISCPDRAPFREGGEFIVYADLSAAGLNIGYLSEAVPIDDADEHLAYLATVVSYNRATYAASLGRRVVVADSHPIERFRRWPLLAAALFLLLLLLKLSPLVSRQLRHVIAARRE